MRNKKVVGLLLWIFLNGNLDKFNGFADWINSNKVLTISKDRDRPIVIYKAYI